MSGLEVVLVGCCAKKLPHKAAAKDLYRSALFVKARAFAEATGSPWAIISAKHGLLMPEAEVEPYDVTVAERGRRVGNMGRKADRQGFASSLRRALDARFPGASFIFLAGSAYRPWTGGSPALKLAEPLEGLGVGERLRWLDRETAALVAETAARSASSADEPVEASDVGLDACDFCGLEAEVAVSEQGGQRFEGDVVPAKICAKCATWALAQIVKAKLATPELPNRAGWHASEDGRRVVECSVEVPCERHAAAGGAS